MPLEHPVTRTAFETSGMSRILVLRGAPGKRYARERVPQQHLDRLSAVDAAFLHQEGPATHMHIGGLGTVDGPPPPPAPPLAHTLRRLPPAARHRQPPPPPPLRLVRPNRVDGPPLHPPQH